jgi:3-phosphoshikimate 1-carboxyvinyltransferase
MKFKTISSKSINSNISIPTSKSYANRAIILATLESSQRIVADIPKSSDVQEMIEVLESLSLVSEYDGNKVVITKSFPEDEVISKTIKEVYLGEGGTTIRFLLTLLSLGSQNYRVKVHPRFKLRPYLDQLNLLRELGVIVVESTDKDILCELQGPITFPAKINIDCSKTTQVASSFLLLKSKYQFEMELLHSDSSMAYVEMTNSMIQKSSKEVYKVPVDYSSAGYFIALGLFLQKIHLNNVNSIDAFQADSTIINVLDQISANYKFDDGLTIIPNDHYKHFLVDGSECLDLVPTLCFIAANIEGTSKIFNIKNLVYKETDRLKGIKDILLAFGVEYKSDEESIEIHGKKLNTNVKELQTLPDHRLIMMGSLFLKLSGGGEISPFSEVSKSFPDFFTLIN